MRKKLLNLCAALLCCNAMMAQMDFTFPDLQGVEQKTMADGSTLIQLPSGTDLNNLGGKMWITVDGQPVDAAAIKPNPSTTFITDGEIETFVYNGKAYSFRFTEGEYFTAVFFGDPHVDQGDGYTTSATMKEMVQNIVNMGKDGKTKKVTFAKLPNYVPTADIVFCLGDMDKDSQSNKNVFNNAMQGFNDAGIPFITIAGNHDFAPDFWTGESGGYGVTGGSGGDNCNKVALDIVKTQYGKAAGFGGFTVNTITDSNLGNSVTQAGHFTFSFKDVRFYCGNNYWFQKPYKGNYTEVMGTVLSTPTYYAADNTIKALNDVVDGYQDEASIWLQHYPFVSQFDADDDASARWWLDQSDVGRCIMPTDAATSEYYNGGTNVLYTSDEGKNLATKKKKALADIITKTKNPVHFSGHAHKTEKYSYSASNGTTFTDYTIAMPRAAYVVLCKAGVGVVEVIQTTF